MDIKHILVPTDLSEHTGEALDYAVQLAGATNATVHLLHVVEVPLMTPPHPGAITWDFPSAALIDEARASLEEVRSRLGVPSVGEVVVGIPADSILSYAARIPVDLIVMATHGRRGLGRMLMGSATETVLRQADCPVMSVRMHRHPKPATIPVEEGIEETTPTLTP